MQDNLDRIVGESRWGLVLQDLLTNSAHFPVVNLFLEVLTEGPLEYLSKPDFPALFTGALTQSWFLGTWRFRGTPRPFWGNLIGPAIYTLLEVAIEGVAFFGSPVHVAYWAFSLAVGTLQWLSLRLPSGGAKAAVFLESYLRSNLILAGYWLFGYLIKPEEYGPPAVFFADPAHVFVALVISFLGLVMGLANVNAWSYLGLLKKTAAQLKLYSEWFLGPRLLSRAVADPAAMSLHPAERAVLFMDIRGFTSWSESRGPAEVVGMLNAYFEASETAWQGREVVKSRFIADEVMLVLDSAHDALEAARDLRRTAAEVLGPLGLGAGIGLHYGPLIEGLIGARGLKQYDVIGDTANTGKRICDQAAAGEILASRQFWERLEPAPPAGPERLLTLKGKSRPFAVVQAP